MSVRAYLTQHEMNLFTFMQDTYIYLRVKFTIWWNVLQFKTYAGV